MDRTPRLAELVVHLTDCAPDVALAAVAASAPPDFFDTQTADDALAVVARAMCSIRHLDLREAVDLRTPDKVPAK
jgi:hypothetical protein